MKTKEQVYIHIKNEETRKKAVEVLKRHNQSISFENPKLSDYNENEYLKFDKDAFWWVTSDYKTNLQQVTVEKLDEILSKEIRKTLEEKFTLENIKIQAGYLSKQQISDIDKVFTNNNLIPIYGMASTKDYDFICAKNEYSFENKTEITYEKFMELFTNTINLKNKQPEPTISEYFEYINKLPPTDFSFKESNQLGNFIDFLCNKKESPRPVEKSILQEAEEIINGSRAEDYGSVTENFTKIAVGWKEIFADGNFTPRRVALAMVWLKICRDVNTPKRDNLVDSIGYVACVEKMDNEAN